MVSIKSNISISSRLLISILVVFSLPLWDEKSSEFRFKNIAFAQDLAPLIPLVGSTFCKWLFGRGLIHRKQLGLCGEPTCSWDDWNHAASVRANSSASSQERIVLSYAHNGFGNQLWQHTVAFMVAEAMKAKLYISIVPDNLLFDGVHAPHSWEGMNAMRALLPDEFEYDLLPSNATERKICDSESFVVMDRPRDWRNGTYKDIFRPSLVSLVKDDRPRCIKMLGYFQNLPLCADDARQLWTPRMKKNFTDHPGENDVSIYLRCLPRHYHFNSPVFYETILDNVKFERVWLFQAPECPTSLSPDRRRDGLVHSVIRLLRDKYNATRWPSLPAKTEDEATTQLLHDLAGIVQSRKLILPMSSWAFWGGFLSNATEIHVNAPPHHQFLPTMPQYVYHSEHRKTYFGRFDPKENDIVFAITLTTSPTPMPTVASLNTSAPSTSPA